MNRTTAVFGLMAALLIAGAAAGHKIELEIWCPDLDLDGDVDQHDVQTWVDQAGECPPGESCSADVNHNGHVGKIDLAYMVAEWGPCPCKGDLDGDSDVDQDDAALLVTAIANDPDCRTDVNMNGVVEGVDYFIETEAWTNDPDSDVRADVNRSNSLDVLDVVAVFEAMATSLDCRADLNGDGRVDDDDGDAMPHLIEAHGSCPQYGDP